MSHARDISIIIGLFPKILLFLSNIFRKSADLIATTQFTTISQARSNVGPGRSANSCQKASAMTTIRIPKTILSPSLEVNPGQVCQHGHPKSITINYSRSIIIAILIAILIFAVLIKEVNCVRHKILRRQKLINITNQASFFYGINKSIKNIVK